MLVGLIAVVGRGAAQRHLPGAGQRIPHDVSQWIFGSVLRAAEP
jgi:hypothetical protein